jgi:predicted HAD superfamily Cof-like phosphohydrolase
MNKQFKQVEEFNRAFDLPINVSEIDNKQIELRKRLLLEELEEYWEGVQMHIHSEEKQYPKEARKKAIREILDALIDIKYVLIGIYVYAGFSYSNANKYVNNPKVEMMNYDDSFTVYRELEETIENGIDDAYDLGFINSKVNYLLASHGMLDIFEAGFDEVHSSNISKLEDGKPIYREDGKVLKGKDYFKPNLKKVLGYE